jgi:hypothetical protein
MQKSKVRFGDREHAARAGGGVVDRAQSFSVLGVWRPKFENTLF